MSSCKINSPAVIDNAVMVLLQALIVMTNDDCMYRASTDIAKQFCMVVQIQQLWDKKRHFL